jgi:hypothetical protein
VATPLRILEKAREIAPAVLHGVSMNPLDHVIAFSAITMRLVCSTGLRHAAILGM